IDDWQRVDSSGRIGNLSEPAAVLPQEDFLVAIGVASNQVGTRHESDADGITADVGTVAVSPSTMGELGESRLIVPQEDLLVARGVVPGQILIRGKGNTLPVPGDLDTIDAAVATTRVSR